MMLAASAYHLISSPIATKLPTVGKSIVQKVCVASPVGVEASLTITLKTHSFDVGTSSKSDNVAV